MSLISSTIPNMIGGVSRQSPSARSRNASADELNTLASPVSGNIKRPAFDWIAQVPGEVNRQEPGVGHAFETSDGSKFVLLVDADINNQARMSVIRSDGEVYSIDLSGDEGYISETTKDFADTFRFLSVGDTTFILNRTITPSELPVPETVDLSDFEPDVTVPVEADLPPATDYAAGTVLLATDTGNYFITRRVALFSGLNGIYNGRSDTITRWYPYVPTAENTRINPKQAATFFVKQAVHDTRYALKIDFEDGTVGSASYTTPASVDGSGNPVDIDTDQIASGIASSYSGDGTATVIGSTVSIIATKPIRRVTHEDGFGDRACEAYGEGVQQFTDLPPNEAEGRVVRIIESLSTNQDDYFVEYRDGLWRETVGHGSRTKLDGSTLPIKLLYDPVNDSFSLSQAEWPGRTSGDKESNPAPTFVGRVINSLFLYKGRMAFLSDENVIFSEVGFFENFYRTTLTQYLETDPIDIASATSRTSILYHAVPFDKSLVVFSDKAQFRVLSGDSLTPENVSIDQTTAYSASPTCSPIAVGPNVFFANSNTDLGAPSKYSTVWEYYINPNTERDDAAEVTAEVPRFIEGRIREMKAAANENVVAVLTDTEGGTLYVYRYFWVENRKVVSAWTKWSVSGVTNILSLDFFSDELFALTRDEQGETHLLRCKLEESLTDEGLDFSILLDVKMDKSRVPQVYEADRERTRLRLPVWIPDDYMPVIVVNEENDLGFPVGYVIRADNKFRDYAFFEDDIRDVPGVVGFEYDYEYTFSPIYLRQTVGQGEVPAQNGRLQLKYMTLYFSQTASFTVEITPEGRSAQTAHYTGKQFNDPTASFSKVFLNDEHFRFSSRGRADTTQIKIINSSPFPCAFSSADWEGTYKSRSRRV